MPAVMFKEEKMHPPAPRGGLVALKAPHCNAMTLQPTILLVDDDVDYLHLLNRFFSNHGYWCLTAESGREALDVLEKCETLPIIISDQDMPLMTGLGLMATLENTYPAPPPFIIVTGGSASDLRADAEYRGARAVLQKPVSLKALLALIRSLEKKENG